MHIVREGMALNLPKLVLSIVNQTDTYHAAPASRHLEIFMQARSVETSCCGRKLKICLQDSNFVTRCANIPLLSLARQ